MQLIIRLVIFIALALLPFSRPAVAAGNATCSVSASNVAFGSVNVLPGGAVTTTGSISLNCTNFGKSEVDIFCISIGAGSSSTGSQRLLVSGANSATYDLYQDASYTTLWGSWQTGFDTAGMQVLFTSDANGNLVQSIPIYGKFFPNQNTLIPGAYSSSIAAATTGLYITFGKQGSFACPTGGASATGSFSVTASVTASCLITASNMGFGSVGLLNSAVNSTNVLQPQCTNSTPYSVGLNAGASALGSTSLRYMTGAAGAVSYRLYSNSNRTANWGNTSGTDTVASVGTGSAQSFTVYGQVPTQASPPPGTYSDTVTVSVNY